MLLTEQSVAGFLTPLWLIFAHLPRTGFSIIKLSFPSHHLNSLGNERLCMAANNVAKKGPGLPGFSNRSRAGQVR